MEPHFHITDVRYEAAPDGTIIVSAYEERRGELILRFTCTMMGPNLIIAGRQAMQIGADAHNMAMWGDLVSEDSSH